LKEKRRHRKHYMLLSRLTAKERCRHSSPPLSRFWIADYSIGYIHVGYRVTLVRVNDGRALSCETFAEGWLQGRDAWGRPVDIEHLRDGSLLVSDDKAGAIYRISYENGGN
jgi:glucose/arabinose dehydrogenase